MTEESTRSSYFSKKVSVCPVCSTNFSREDLLTGRGRLIAGEITRELRRHYEPSQKFGEVYPLIYPVTVCPVCRYSAYPQDFSEVPERSLPELIDGTEQRQASLEKILPGLDFTESVGPDDKKESLPFLQIAVIVGDGFDRVRRPIPFYFHIREGEGRIVGNGQFDHIPTVLGGDDRAIQFMGGGGCQDENHLVEMKSLQYLLGTAQMPQVDGIESPPKEPDAPLSFLRRP